MQILLPSDRRATENKTGTSTVGAISKAQKAPNTFQKMSHRAEKCKKGTLWALLTYILLQNVTKTRKGDSFETLKIFRKKVAQCR